MKLFISDLDGTLLKNNQLISNNSINIINELLGNDLNFTIATARSIESAWKLIQPLNLKLPVIVHNGVFIYDPVKKENIVSNLMNPSIVKEILDIYSLHNICPMVYTIDENSQYKVYYQEIYTKGQKEYIDGRLKYGDKRFRKVETFDKIWDESIITLVAIDNEDRLKIAHDLLKTKYDLTYHFTEDIYTKYYWLELTHKNANKKNACERLINLLDVKELICFGDNLNDLPMFEAADFSCAVANANELVKKAASVVIGSNEEDGVAKFIYAKMKNK